MDWVWYTAREQELGSNDSLLSVPKTLTETCGKAAFCFSRDGTPVDLRKANQRRTSDEWSTGYLEPKQHVENIGWQKPQKENNKTNKLY